MLDAFTTCPSPENLAVKQARVVHWQQGDYQSNAMLLKQVDVLLLNNKVQLRAEVLAGLSCYGNRVRWGGPDTTSAVDRWSSRLK